MTTRKEMILANEKKLQDMGYRLLKTKPEEMEKLRGREQEFIFIDEASEIPREVIDETNLEPMCKHCGANLRPEEAGWKCWNCGTQN